jgi:hypothetical protein
MKIMIATKKEKDRYLLVSGGGSIVMNAFDV